MGIDTLSELGERLWNFEGKKWLVVKFIEFQYGELSADCRGHNPVFVSLTKHRLEVMAGENGRFNKVQQIKGIQQTPIGAKTGQDRTGQGQDKEGGCKGEGKPKAAAPVIPLLLQTPAFLEAWGRWLDHLKQKHKPPTTHAVDLQLKKCEGWGEVRSVKALNYSIEKNWQGIYEQHENTNGQNRIQPRSRFADRNKGTLNEGQGHVYAEFMERQNAATKA
jgi:hypothetical protein